MSGGKQDQGGDRLAEFTEFRQRMNERILAEPNQVVRRFFALDTQTYQAGALDVKTKELLGLVASMVLRCDDCISYHVAQCKDAGVSREEFFETFSASGGGFSGPVGSRGCTACRPRPRVGCPSPSGRRWRAATDEGGRIPTHEACIAIG
jgi:AhpD family alkylhydroperoxidase